MKLSRLQKNSLEFGIGRHKDDPNVVLIGIGYKRRNGVRTGEVGIVVGLKKKKPAHQVTRAEMVLPTYQGLLSDVEEYGEIVPHAGSQDLTLKRRPCPPGYSIGHRLVTAGTLGAWVHTMDSEEWHILSNNHVIAASNDGIEGDFIRQPGKHDGGTENDRFARLTKYAQIKFEGDENKKKAARYLWQAWKAPANAVARLVGCPFRLQVQRPHAVEQPYPNLIDGGLARVLLEGWVDTKIPSIGEIQGIRELELGDKVQKTGRTTEHTDGTVEVVSATSRVNYGSGKGIAPFQDQLVIRGDAGDFSAAGDSGSAIIGPDGMLGGLLFAGGSGVTIANRIGHVVAILGVRL